MPRYEVMPHYNRCSRQSTKTVQARNLALAQVCKQCVGSAGRGSSPYAWRLSYYFDCRYPNLSPNELCRALTFLKSFCVISSERIYVARSRQGMSLSFLLVDDD